jgi:hypothetical protein
MEHKSPSRDMINDARESFGSTIFRKINIVAAAWAIWCHRNNIVFDVGLHNSVHVLPRTRVWFCQKRVVEYVASRKLRESRDPSVASSSLCFPRFTCIISESKNINQ